MNKESNNPSFNFFANFRLLVVGLLFSLPLFAQDSEVGVIIPWKAIQKDFAFLNSDVTQNWNDEMDSVALPIDGLVIQIPKVSVSAVMANSQVLVEQGQFGLAINQIQLKLDVSGINIDQTVERVVSGVTVRVRIQADCSAFSLVQDQGKANAVLVLDVNGTSIVPHFQSFKIDWPKTSWKISNIQCVGPQGMGDVIQKQLTDKLGNAEDFRPALEQIVLKQIQKEIEAPLDKWSQPQLVANGSEGLTVRLQKIESLEKGFLFTSTIADPLNPGKDPVPLSVKSAQWDQMPEDAPSLLMPTAGVERILQKRWQRVPDWINYSLNKIPEFQSFVRSRFLQFFLWPDMMNYPKSAQFNLAIQKPAQIPLKWDARGHAQSALETTAWMQSIRDNKGWNYIGIKAAADVDWTMDIQKGRLQISGNPKFNQLSTFVNEDYQKEYGDVYYCESKVEDAIKTALSNVNVGIQLPNLQLTKTAGYQAQGWKALDQNTILIPWLAIKTPASN